MRWIMVVSTNIEDAKICATGKVVGWTWASVIPMMIIKTPEISIIQNRNLRII
jgi:hypothetical protein